MLLLVLEVHFSLLFSNKAHFRVCFVVRNIQSPLFLCRSLLLGTGAPNDYCKLLYSLLIPNKVVKIHSTIKF